MFTLTSIRAEGTKLATGTKQSQENISILEKKCYFCDVITATLLFHWLRLKGPFFPESSMTMGWEEGLEDT